MAHSSKLWQKEYTQKGIPSSYKTSESGALVFLNNWLRKNKIQLNNRSPRPEGRGSLFLRNKVALDLGCGTGRNAFYLVKNGVKRVFAIDFVQPLIEKIKSQNIQKIKAICHDLTKPWPIKTGSIDLVIDIFCFKHQVTFKDRDFYTKELLRVLKPGGILLLSLADAADGYYGSLPKTKIKKDVYKITDPKTSVVSLLYTKASVLRELEKEFILQDFEKSQKPGLMHGRKYGRVTLKFILQKKT